MRYHPTMNVRRLGLLWALFAVLLAAVTIGGVEMLSAFVVPPWPARELRPIDVRALSMASLKTVVNASLVPTYNSWGMRDRERSLSKPPGIDFRTVLVGDSFLEGPMVSQPIGQRIEDIWAKAGRKDLEAVNLGVSATGPVQYYYRIKNVALTLQPDAIVLTFFSGNDFIDESLSWTNIPPLIAERPTPSWLGAVAPRFTWLAVNRLGLMEWSGSDDSAEFVMINAALRKSPAERLETLAQYVKKHSYPDKDEATIREVLARGGEQFWDAFGPRERDQEFLAGWILTQMVGWETGVVSGPSSDEEARRTVNVRQRDATLTWLVGAAELARSRGLKFLVVLVPPPTVDPYYTDFWAPWPRFRRFPIARQTAHRALREALEAKGIRFADLADDLEGKPRTYRLTDGHWTELGTQIAAERVARELDGLRDGR